VTCEPSLIGLSRFLPKRKNRAVMGVSGGKKNSVRGRGKRNRETGLSQLKDREEGAGPMKRKF